MKAIGCTEPLGWVRGEAKKGCPQMAQIYADESPPSASDVHQPQQIHPGFPSALLTFRSFAGGDEFVLTIGLSC
jgi:hypothetical protein